MGYFQYPTFYSVNCYGGDNKAAALSPGAAHDRRAASERYTESTDEIGSAARRGARSGWRPFMMNEAGVGTPSLPLFCLVFACAKNLSGKGKNYRPRNFVGGPHFIHSPGSIGSLRELRCVVIFNFVGTERHCLVVHGAASIIN
jgi:hypothetical protein